jgi:ankyrin repeat protein
MSASLPDRPSLEFLKKLAKDRLLEMRTADPDAKLHQAQLAVARDHGFPSWRALKAEIDRRRAPNVAEFFRACINGDVAALRQLLRTDPALVRDRDSSGAAGLHRAIAHPEAVRILLEHGADPNVRDVGDNASPLHVAAANGELDSVRLLLDAGADPQGEGDAHNGDVIGWASREGNDAVIDLLLARGARHHIFSAIATRNVELVERLVDEDPDSLLRRRSRFENGYTPLHDAIAPPDPGRRPDYVILQRLIELGADLDARDDRGRTPLDVAMLHGDREAIRILKAAGAQETEVPTTPGDPAGVSAFAGSIQKSMPMFFVRDMRATVRWYESIGFTVSEQFEDGDQLVFARVSFGNGGFALSPGGASGFRDVRLWFFTDRVEDLYQVLKKRQQRAAHAAFADVPGEEPDVWFEEDLYEPFYGGRQFSVRDLNGLHLIFWQPDMR